MIPYSADFESKFLSSGKNINDLTPEEATPQINKIIK
jgi:hypothetical protein